MAAIAALAMPAAWADPQCIAYTEPTSTLAISESLSSHFDWLNEHGYRTVSPDDPKSLQSSRNAADRRLVLVFPAMNMLFRDVIAPQLAVFSFRAGVLDASLHSPGKDRVAGGTATAAGRPLMMLPEHVTRIRPAAGIVRPVQITPQGDVGSGAAGRRYLREALRYESADEMLARIRGDLSMIANAGSATRTMLWPQSDYSHAATRAAAAAGFTNHLILSDDAGSSSVSPLLHCRPLSMDASLSELAQSLRPPELRGRRVLRLDLDPDMLGDHAYARSIAEAVQVIHPSEVVVDAFVRQEAPSGGYAAIFPSRRVRMAADLLGHLISQLNTIEGTHTAAVLPTSPCPSGPELALAEEIVMSAPLDALYLESDPLRGGSACPDGWSRATERLRHWRPELRIARSLAAIRMDDYAGLSRSPSAAGLPGTMIEIDAGAADRQLIDSARRFSFNRPLMLDTIVMTRVDDAGDGTDAARTLRQGGVLHRGVRVRLAFSNEQTEQLRRELSTEVFPFPRQDAVEGSTDGMGGSEGGR